MRIFTRAQRVNMKLRCQSMKTTIKVKPIQWGPVTPGEYSTLSYIEGVTPVGKFQIDWKSWKTDPCYSMSCEFKPVYFDYRYDINEAKQECQRIYEETILKCLELKT